MKPLPKYIDLANMIREQIESGVLKHGDKLKTEKEYAVMHSISRHTVRHAIGMLEMDGIVVSKHGSGTYVNTGNPPREKNMTVGFLCASQPEGLLADSLGVIESILQEHDYMLRYSCSRNRWDQERVALLQYLRNPVDGLLVEATKSGLPNSNIDLYKALRCQGTPTVFVGNGYADLPDCVAVSVDHASAARKAVEYLHNKERKKIGGLFFSEDAEGREQCRGFTQAMLDRELPLKDDQIQWIARETVWDAASPLEEEPEPLRALRHCNGIICSSDSAAVCLIHWLHRKGVTVPKEISVVSLGPNSYGKVSPIPLTGIGCFREELAGSSAKKLIRMMGGTHEKETILSCRVFEGESG